MKKKFVFIAFSLATGGAEKRLACITNYLAAQEHDVKIVLLEDAPQVYETDPRIEIIKLSKQSHIKRSKTALFMRKVLLKLTRFFAKKQYAMLDEVIRIDQSYVSRLVPILQAHPTAMIVSFMTFPSLATAMALKGLNNKWVFVECNSPHIEFPIDSPVPVLRKKLYRRANGAAFQTEEAMSYYKFLPNVKTAVIPNPIPRIDVDRFEGVRKKNIVSFCRFSVQKNIPLLIDAFTLFAEKHLEYVLDIYGDGEMKQPWMEYAKKSPFADRIIFHDAERDIAKKVYDSGMFVSSSDREGISNAMLEALAVGLPCVCTDCPAGGARMAIKNYESGILVPVGDAEQMCKAMCYFASNPMEAERCSKNAVAINETLKESRIVDMWEKFLLSV